MRRRTALLVPLLLAGSVAVQPVWARSPQVGGAWEKQLTFDDAYAEGEPSIAVNPRNPKNIVLTFLANVGYGFYGAEHGHVPTNPRYHGQTMQGCDELVSFDAGRTWRHQQLPIGSFHRGDRRCFRAGL